MPLLRLSTAMLRRKLTESAGATPILRTRRGAAETQGRVLNAVFFGGGTPSLMHPDTFADHRTHRNHWPMPNDREITLEANPGSVEAGRFRDFTTAASTRSRWGAGAERSDLKRLGRIHTVMKPRQPLILRVQLLSG